MAPAGSLPSPSSPSPPRTDAADCTAPLDSTWINPCIERSSSEGAVDRVAGLPSFPASALPWTDSTPLCMERSDEQSRSEASNSETMPVAGASCATPALTPDARARAIMERRCIRHRNTIIGKVKAKARTTQSRAARTPGVWRKQGVEFVG
eukprot:scaffold260951_cov23-Tisochrysis_lutea.AAC.2